MIRVRIQNHVRIRVELVLEPDAPHIGAIEIRLGNTEDNECWNNADEFERHEPADRATGLERPPTVYEIVAAGETGNTGLEAHGDEV